MKQILLAMLFLCTLGISAQDVVVTRQKKQQTTTTKPKQNSTKPAPANKPQATTAKPEQNSSQKESPSAGKPKQNEQKVLVSDPTGYSNGHGYVDLGLPSGTKWATCNVGASSPSDYGGYYAWGETETKSTCNWSTYKWCNGTETTMTKYCKSSSYGTVDNKTTLEPSDDVAHVKWGGSWRMPTRAEQEELCNTNNCTWTWTTQGGKNGYKVTSKKNGNSIFLPAAGFSQDGTDFSAGSYGYYWSSSLNTSNSSHAYGLDFRSNYVDWSNYNRYNGVTVRPVCP